MVSEIGLHHDTNDDLIDPEPFAMALNILAAVGSVASLLSLAGPSVRRHIEGKRKLRHQARDCLVGIRLTLNELRGLTRSLEIVAVSAGHHWGPEGAAKFGAVQLVFTKNGFTQWKKLQDDVSRCTKRIHRDLNSLLLLFASSRQELSRDSLERLTHAVEGLNELFKMISERSLQDFLQAMEESIGNVMDAVRELELGLGPR